MPRPQRGHQTTRSPAREGFSLVELLVVVCIIAVLVSILAPGLRRANDLARRTWCHANNHTMMQAVNVYATQHTDRLPFGERTWPWMGMLDVHEHFLVKHTGGTGHLHCPSDRRVPGGTAVWWRGWYGHPMTPDDRLHLPEGEPVEVDYSYYYFVKMYWDVGDDGVLTHTLRSWKKSDVRCPDSLIVQRCWESHALGQTWGMQAAFIDGHTEWVDISRIHKACAYGDYNLDWTFRGIRGRDID